MIDLTPRSRAMLREMGIEWPTTSKHDSTEPAQPAPSAVARAAESPPSVSAPPAMRLREEPLETFDWTALQAEVAACRRCGLCETRRKTVFGVGHPRAHWMVVGEAPGEQEDRQGEPFVGAAGQLLDRMLAAIGLSRTGLASEPLQSEDGASGRGEPGDLAAADPSRQVFITNTVKCRPPQNRNPQPEELAACAPVLQRQIELVRPRLLLAMGRFAAQQLLGTDEPIGRLRGKVHHLRGAREGLELPVVVTYHPAYLLRNPIDKAKAWDDLCLAVDTMAGVPLTPSSRP